MARNRRSKVPFRRRREGKTNYHLRRKFVLSGKRRVVIRRTNRQTLIQLVSSEATGDTTHISINSKVLINLGWKGATGNVPASYLMGYAFGKKTLLSGVSSDESLILDMGLATKFYGGRIFAALKGAVDAGLNIAHSDVIFPSEERIRGEHISSFSKSLSDETHQFSKYQIKPTELPNHFDDVRKKIETTKKL